MTYWLSPIISTSPFIIGKERFKINEKDALILRSRFTAMHPFFVPFLKTHILPEGENEYVCGVEVFSLEGNESIIFDGKQLSLSKCAYAFINKLPTLNEIAKKRLEFTKEISAIERDYPAYIEEIESWWDKNWIVVLFKE